MTTFREPDDHELWSRVAIGDTLSLGTLLDRHQRAVYNHCFRLTASWSTAEELCSQVFIEVWRQRERTTPRGETVLPWLLTVATNLARNEHRSLRRRQRLVNRVGPPEMVPDPADEVASRIDDERRMGALLDAVRQLPRGEREAFALCAWSGVSYADASAALNIGESSVRSRVSRARARLARILGEPVLAPTQLLSPAPTSGESR